MIVAADKQASGIGEHSQQWGRAADGLHLLFWTFLLNGLTWSLGSTSRGLMRMLRMEDSYGWDSEWVGWMSALSTGELVLSLTLAGVTVMALVWLIRIPREVGAGPWLLLAMGAACVGLLLDFGYLLLGSFGQIFSSGEWLGGIYRCFSWINLAGHLALATGLLMGLWRMAEHFGRELDSALVGMVIGATLLLYGFPFLRWEVDGLRAFFDAHGLVFIGAKLGLLGAWTTAWSLLLWNQQALLREQLAKGRERGLDLALGLAWLKAAAGLSLYRTALLWKVWLLVGSVILGVVAAMSRSLPLVQAVLGVSALLGLVTGGFMLWGLLRYLGLPAQSRARPAAVVALLVAALALMGDGAAFGLVFQGLAGRGLGGMQAALMQAQLLGCLVQALGLVILLALLFSFLMAARSLKRERAVQRIGKLFWLVPGTFLAALGVRVLMATGELRSAVVAIVLGLGVLALAIVTLVTYIQLLGWLAKAAKQHGEQSLESVFD